MATDPWRVGQDGLVLTVRLTPRGGRDRIDGVAELDGRSVLKARVSAPPADGAANAALVALIAKAAGVPKSQVAISSGATGRVKQVVLTGDPGALAGALARAIPPLPD